MKRFALQIRWSRRGFGFPSVFFPFRFPASSVLTGVVSGTMGLALLGGTVLLPARALAAEAEVTATAEDDAAMDAALAKIYEVAAANPQQGVDLLTQFIQQHPHLSFGPGIGLYMRLGPLYADKLQDTDKAVAVLDEGLQKYAGKPYVGELLKAKERALLAAKRPQEAEAAMRLYGPRFSETEPPRIAGMWFDYVAILEANRKSEQVPGELQGVLQTMPALLDANTQGDGWMYERLMDAATSQGKMDEALSWAKLQFVQSRFDNDAIARSVAMLGSAWSLIDAKANQGFIAAQKDPAQPNPLQNVPLPKVDADVLQAQAAQMQGRDRISLLLWINTPQARRKAMLEAVRLMRAQPDAPDGVQEVCRVFKAADLNLNRANAYLAFVKSGEGDDPIAAFFKESVAPAPNVAAPDAPAPK